MNNIRLAITPLNTMRQVGPVNERDYALLNDTLQRELGPDYAGFLAEPVPSGDGVRIDWYTDAKTRPQSLEELDPQERSALLKTTETRKQAIRALADKLDLGARSDKEVAKALRNALQTPDTGWLYRVDGKPVIVGWGYTSGVSEQRDMGMKAVGTATGTPTASMAQASIPNSPMSQIDGDQAASEKAATGTGDQPIRQTSHIVHETVVSRSSFHWLSLFLWSLFGILALIFLWLLLSSNALNRWSGVFSKSDIAVEEPLDPSLQRIADLNNEISALEQALRDKQNQCTGDNQPNSASVPPDGNQVNPFGHREPERRADAAPSTGENETPPIQVIVPPVIIAPPAVAIPDQRAEAVTPEATPPQTPSAPEPEETEPQQPDVPQQSDRRRDLDERINRAGVKTGALQITLTWDGRSDLDLSIVCPNGTRVFFKRRSSCGATLDRDANRRPDMISREPVENIYWNNPASIPKKIPVYVDYFDNHGDPRRNIPFRLRIRKTTIDPQTNQPKVEDKVIDGVADGNRRRNPRQIYVITNP